MSRFVFGFTLFALPSVLMAATIPVTTTTDEYAASDNGVCSLREAVESANRDMDWGGCTGEGAYGDDVVSLPAGTFVLSRSPSSGDEDEDDNVEGDIDVRDVLTILGAGRDNTTIDGASIARVLQVVDEFDISFRLDGVTVRNGAAGEEPGNKAVGGGLDVSNDQPVELVDCAFIGNTASPGDGDRGRGGAVRAKGDLLVDNCLFEDNVAGDADDDASGGGAISAAAGGTVEIVDSVFRNNRVLGGPPADRGGIFGHGGAIHAGDGKSPGSLSIVGSIFENNSAVQDGGAIRLGGEATISVDSSSFVGNTAGRDGGAIRIGGRPSGDLRVANSTFYGNSAAGTEVAEERGGGSVGGGAIRLGGRDKTLTLSNVTIDGNTVTGSAIGAGVRVGGDGTGLIISNTAISGGIGGDDCGVSAPTLRGGLISTQGVNLDSDTSCGAEVTASPAFMMTSEFGLPVLVPSPSGPLVDGGDNSTCELIDQIGTSRPVGGACDIGAFEYSAALFLNSVVQVPINAPWALTALVLALVVLASTRLRLMT